MEDKTNTVKAMGRDLNISFKDAVVLCNHVKGMRLPKAMEFLDKLQDKEIPAPYKKHQKGIGHRKGSVKIGKYPVKAAKNLKTILQNLSSNAEYKGLDPDTLEIIHLQALKGRGILKRRPKGRWKAWTTQYVHIQAIGKDTSLGE